LVEQIKANYHAIIQSWQQRGGSTGPDNDSSVPTSSTLLTTSL
jgi:hypothetical protein